MLRLVAVLIGVLAAMPAHALTVTPITLEMSAAGKQTRAVITITNSSDEVTAIEPTFDKVSLSEDGNVTREATSADNFLILPLQAMLQPGATQTFRVQWVGAPDIPQSESYFITFNQLPIEDLAQKKGLTILTAFSVAVNVSPASARPAMQLVGTGLNSSGKPVITVQNPTAAHALLRHAVITVHADGSDYEVPAAGIQQAYGNGLLQPWRKRRFVLPVDLPPGTRSVTASLNYSPPAN